ncbi:hypothetical protein VP249E411_P0115 [Vibrio phage 249E41-1]|nr:hypothetical protein VP249E411_P0115 [Vibrio phage 249E41-1]
MNNVLTNTVHIAHQRGFYHLHRCTTATRVCNPLKPDSLFIRKSRISELFVELVQGSSCEELCFLSVSITVSTFQYPTYNHLFFLFKV